MFECIYIYIYMSVWDVNSVYFLHLTVRVLFNAFVFLSVCLQFRNPRVLQVYLFLHLVCKGKGLLLFMLSQSRAWPTNKGHPVDGKTAKG